MHTERDDALPGLVRSLPFLLGHPTQGYLRLVVEDLDHDRGFKEVARWCNESSAWTPWGRRARVAARERISSTLVAMAETGGPRRSVALQRLGLLQDPKAHNYLLQEAAAGRMDLADLCQFVGMEVAELFEACLCARSGRELVGQRPPIVSVLGRIDAQRLIAYFTHELVGGPHQRDAEREERHRRGWRKTPADQVVATFVHAAVTGRYPSDVLKEFVPGVLQQLLADLKSDYRARGALVSERPISCTASGSEPVGGGSWNGSWEGVQAYETWSVECTYAIDYPIAERAKDAIHKLVDARLLTGHEVEDALRRFADQPAETMIERTERKELGAITMTHSEYDGR